MSSRIREVGRFRIVLRAQERLAALGQEEPLREKVEWPKRVGTKPPALRRRRAPRVSYSDIGQLPAPHSAPVTPRVTPERWPARRALAHPRVHALPPGAAQVCDRSVGAIERTGRIASPGKSPTATASIVTTQDGKAFMASMSPSY